MNVIFEIPRPSAVDRDSEDYKRIEQDVKEFNARFRLRHYVACVDILNNWISEELFECWNDCDHEWLENQLNGIQDMLFRKMNNLITIRKMVLKFESEERTICQPLEKWV